MSKVTTGRVVCDGENGLVPHWMRDGPQEYVPAEVADELLTALEWLVALLPDPELDADTLQGQHVRKAKSIIRKATTEE